MLSETPTIPDVVLEPWTPSGLEAFPAIPDCTTRREGRRDLYSVDTPCGGCDRVLTFYAGGSREAVIALQSLFTSGLTFYCPPCGRERRRNRARNGI